MTRDLRRHGFGARRGGDIGLLLQDLDSTLRGAGGAHRVAHHFRNGCEPADAEHGEQHELHERADAHRAGLHFKRANPDNARDARKHQGDDDAG